MAATPTPSEQEPESRSSFEEQAQESAPGLLREFTAFLAENKKWWLLPIVIVLGLLSVLVLAAGTGAAPFIYTLF